MKYSIICAGLLAGLLPTVMTVGYAADQEQARDRDRLDTPDQTRDQDRLREQDQIKDDQIYGSKLMTDQERNEYRNRMRTAKTDQEREQIRNEHHKQMQSRAKERGLNMPDEPPMRGMGTGPGPAGGQGGGSGGGGGRR